MPSYVIADMLGIPLEDGVELYGLTEKIHAAPESQAAGRRRWARCCRCSTTRREIWERKRAEPADDLATLIATASRRRREWTSSTSTCSSCCSSTPAATRPATSSPAGWMRCSHIPTSWRGSAPTSTRGCRPRVEELLRWISPVVYMRRTAHARHRARRCRDRRRPEGRHVLRLGEPRSRRLRTDGRTCSTWRARRTSTSPSVAVDRTSASVPTSPASRSRRCCASC